MNRLPHKTPSLPRGSPAAILLTFAAFIGMNQAAEGQELEPRTFANTAVGVNLIGAAAGVSRGNVLLDPSLPIEDLDGNLEYGAVQYLRSFGLLERSAKVYRATISRRTGASARRWRIRSTSSTASA